MYCKNCGGNLNQGSMFCVNCGEKVENVINTIVDNNQTTAKHNKIINDKIICIMVIITIIFNSMPPIMGAIIENINQAPYSGLWFLVLPIMLVVRNIYLFIALIFSIINIKKSKIIFLILIMIFVGITMFLSIKTEFLIKTDLDTGILSWLYIISSSILLIIILIRIFSYKNNKGGH